MGVATARVALRKFCEWVIYSFGPEFLGSWSDEELEKEREVNYVRGFLGMMGGILPLVLEELFHCMIGEVSG